MTKYETTTVHNRMVRTYRPYTETQYNNEPVTCREVFRWPEFEALMKRLRVDLDAPITGISIDLDMDSTPIITTKVQGLDATKPEPPKPNPENADR